MGGTMMASVGFNENGIFKVNGVEQIGVYPFRNRIINGDMAINQINGTAEVIPTGNVYVTDGWRGAVSVASKLKFQQVADAPNGFKYSTKITVASQYSPSASDDMTFQQRIEGQMITDFAFGTAGAVTINTSMWIKGSVAGKYSVSIVSSDTSRSYIGTINVTTSWSKVSINLAGANDGTWNTDNTVGMFLMIDLGSGSNFNTTEGAWQTGSYRRTADSVTFVNQAVGSTLNITGVQLEKVPTGATQGTDFEFLPYDVSLRRCQRYYQVFSSIGGGWKYGTAGADRWNCDIFFKEKMRVVPTITNSTGIYENCSNLTFHATDNYRTTLRLTVPTTGTYRWYAGVVYLSAEL